MQGDGDGHETPSDSDCPRTFVRRHRHEYSDAPGPIEPPGVKLLSRGGALREQISLSKHCWRCAGLVSRLGGFNSGTQLHVDLVQWENDCSVSSRRAFDSLDRLHFRGIGSLVERQPSKLNKRIRFSHPAPVCGIRPVARIGRCQRSDTGSSPVYRSKLEFGLVLFNGSKLVLQTRSDSSILSESTKCDRSLYGKAAGCEPVKEDSSSSGHPKMRV